MIRVEKMYEWRAYHLRMVTTEHRIKFQQRMEGGPLN
jgi:hypothetical protein